MNIKRRTKIMNFEKLPKVSDARFCANVFRQSVPRRRTSAGKDALAKLGQCRLIQWAGRARAQGPQASGGPKQPMR